MTLKRLAADVGVSPMTVSNAFNRPDQLSAALRERILERAHQVGYAGPDPLARGLRRGRAGAIGVVSDTPLSYAFADPAASAVLAGVCAAAEAEQLGMVLVPPRSTIDAVVDGVVVYSVAEDDPLLSLATARGLPVVVIDQPAGTGLPTVGIDDEAAARAAAGHLAALGHERVAVVSFGLANDGVGGWADAGRRASSVYAVTRARLAGYAAVFGDDVPVWECQGSSRALGRAAAEPVLATSPTAILATSDELALGLLGAVPDGVAVVGFDDVPAAADAGLTTVRQDHHAKGRRAGELLLAALRGEAISSPPLLPHELVVRAVGGPGLEPGTSRL